MLHNSRKVQVFNKQNQRTLGKLGIFHVSLREKIFFQMNVKSVVILLQHTPVTESWLASRVDHSSEEHSTRYKTTPSNPARETRTVDSEQPACTVDTKIVSKLEWMRSLSWGIDPAGA